MNSTSGRERRVAPRFPIAAEHGPVRARLRSGPDVVLVEISAGGAVLESLGRLLPGSRTELRVSTPSLRFALVGQILRAEVCALGSSVVRYRGAFQFDRLNERAAASLGTSARASATRSQTASSGAQAESMAELEPSTVVQQVASALVTHQ